MVMVNNKPCKISGTERVSIKIFDRMVRTFDEVRHVLDLKRNLISFSILNLKGHKYTSEGGVLKVCKSTRDLF